MLHLMYAPNLLQIGTVCCGLFENGDLVTARRKAAAKRKKLKNLGKSKSTDTEEEEDDGEEDGKLHDSQSRHSSGAWLRVLVISSIL